MAPSAEVIYTEEVELLRHRATERIHYLILRSAGKKKKKLYPNVTIRVLTRSHPLHCLRYLVHRVCTVDNLHRGTLMAHPSSFSRSMGRPLRRTQCSAHGGR